MESHHGTEDTEDDVRLPFDVGEGGGHEVGQRKVEDPVSCGGETDALGTVFQREDFGGVDPCGGSLDSHSVSLAGG